MMKSLAVEAVRPNVYPSPVRDIGELDQRLSIKLHEGVILSDLPVVAGRLAAPSKLLPPDDEVRLYNRCASGSLEINQDGSIGKQTTQPGPGFPRSTLRSLLGPLATIAAADARAFMDISPAESVQVQYAYYRGMYAERQVAGYAHLDIMTQGFGYIWSTAPPTIFFPGYFTREQFEAAEKDSSKLPHVTFGPHEVLRTNALQLHKAPKIEEGPPVPRALVLLDILNKR